MPPAIRILDAAIGQEFDRNHATAVPVGNARKRVHFGDRSVVDLHECEEVAVAEMAADLSVEFLRERRREPQQPKSCSWLCFLVLAERKFSDLRSFGLATC